MAKQAVRMRLFIKVRTREISLIRILAKRGLYVLLLTAEKQWQRADTVVDGKVIMKSLSFAERG
jgi:hypothetical protein